MKTISTRIAALSKLLMAIAHTQTTDACEAHHLTHVALLRILDKDPDLEHYEQIVATLRDEAEWRMAAA